MIKFALKIYLNVSDSATSVKLLPVKIKYFYTNIKLDLLVQTIFETAFTGFTGHYLYFMALKNVNAALFYNLNIIIFYNLVKFYTYAIFLKIQLKHNFNLHYLSILRRAYCKILILLTLNISRHKLFHVM